MTPVMCDRLTCTRPAAYHVTTVWGRDRRERRETLCQEHAAIMHEQPARNENCRAAYRSPVRQRGMRGAA